MDYENLKKKLEGCYVTVPTPFKDIKNLPLNFDALKDYVEFLLGNGLNNENCTLLFGGAAGDFSAMSFDERLSLAKDNLSSKLIAEKSPAAPPKSSVQFSLFKPLLNKNST